MLRAGSSNSTEDTGIPYEGNYSTWLEAKEKRLQVEQRHEAARQKAIKAEFKWYEPNQRRAEAEEPAFRALMS